MQPPSQRNYLKLSQFNLILIGVSTILPKLKLFISGTKLRPLYKIQPFS